MARSSTARNYLLAGSLILSSYIAAPAQAAYWSPHVGVDYKWWGLSANGGHIAPYSPYYEIFPYVDHGLNFYAGTRINGYFGIDFGFEQSDRVQKTRTFSGGEVYFVTPELAGNGTNINLRVRDFHLDLNFYNEVARNFELFMMIGVALMHIDTHIFHYSSATSSWVEYSNTTPNKSMGRFGLGAQYNVLPCLGIKVSFNSEPGRRINYIGLDQTNLPYSIYPYKTEISYNLGLVYSFSDPRRHKVYDYEDPFAERNN